METEDSLKEPGPKAGDWEKGYGGRAGKGRAGRRQEGPAAQQRQGVFML